MSADPDEDAGDDQSTAVDAADDEQAAHTGEGVETIGGRESTRDEDREWEFTLEDIAERERERDESEGNIAGSLTSDQPLEPGDIDLENAFFVLLGVLIVVGLIASLVVAL